ncbi:MAG: hypothetical protein GYA42_05045 [Syntrophomonadaceae bacterium]|nr:hypothetical protein [Syntrophomonadaceae bacterium]
MKLNEYIAKRDRRLVLPWMGDTALRLTGEKAQDIYACPRRHLELVEHMEREFSADFVYPLDHGNLFTETLALQIKPRADGFVCLGEPLLSHGEQLRQLSIPDPFHAGNMPAYLKALTMIAAQFSKPLALALTGPFTLAADLIGITELARATIRSPLFVQEVMAFTTEVVRRFVQAAAEAGVRLLCLSEPTAVILAPPSFKTIVSPHLQEIFSSLPPGVWGILHVCGDSGHLLPQMLQCGVEGLSLDQVMDLPQVAVQVPPEIVVIGNLDPVHVLRELDSVRVRQHTLQLLRSMQIFPNYLFSFGCDCTGDTPIENLKTALEAAQTPLKDL